ncbi:hypothetical protein J7E50_10860 [Pedobacter sp. ISL-68]|uniref:hypothetical protein n=1 Tax=unclassified Pedobacter TaxID=2628915 RepID=UPI001BEBB31C|nr:MULTISPECIES: hypothetical protein [unclassified Pedobacter]MBT2561332.1 hypothetical protein [Pedobacter sp. ISL-64]MBT2590721.1 hypothetical protein [Pedobacter sp. ISL-68]
MNIIDLEGRKIEITQLAETIKEVEKYLAFKPEHRFKSLQIFEQRRAAYWNDILQKLLQLQQRLTK